jgi:hypothetical protein
MKAEKVPGRPLLGYTMEQYRQRLRSLAGGDLDVVIEDLEAQVEAEKWVHSGLYRHGEAWLVKLREMRERRTASMCFSSSSPLSDWAKSRLSCTNQPEHPIRRKETGHEQCD